LFLISAIAVAPILVLLMVRLIRQWPRAMNRTPATPLRDEALSFHAAAEAAPALLWTAQSDGAVDFLSGQLSAFTGLASGTGWGWTEAIHPDDLPTCMERWKHCIASGEPFQLEHRLRRYDDVHRWVQVKANPLHDANGEIVKWIGTCADIEDQKLHQQILEQQIKERTEELGEMNARLHEEMLERDIARRQLDLQNERMMQELTERSKRATMLAKMGEHLQSCITKDEVFSAALGYAPKIFPLARGAVALLNSGRNLAEVLGSWAECKLPAPVFEPSSCWALRTGHPHLVVSGDTTARCAHAEGVNDTYLCIPILAQGESLGVLHFQATPEIPTLADAELSLKTTFAAQIGLSIANIGLRGALRTQSIRDPITGLYNRRYLEETMERETRRAVRAEHGLGILMLDLDHFKKFNDTYGHDAGDNVLRATASLLGKSVRAEDFVCRFGGEEFVIILPMADLKASHARAERIRAKVRELTVLHQGQSLGMITVSVGVAALPQHGTTARELLDAADAALYRAKREGRDRVVAAEEPSAETQAKAAELGK
jgi:diguanylate cyclase (GGDEF)-like protein/PAS domain S-box-containing protein